MNIKLKVIAIGLNIILRLVIPVLAQDTLSTQYTNIAYGSDSRQVLDFWPAKSNRTTPVLVFFHGGGFIRGEKKLHEIQKAALNYGISAVSANYRLTIPKGMTIRESMYDGARVVQFLRSKAKEWHIDPSKIALCGNSAGGMISLWLAFHEDLAAKTSQDPLARISTRVSCVIGWSPPTTLDKEFILTHIGGNPQIHPAIPYVFDIESVERMTELSTQEIVEEFSAITHASSDDPPVYLSYGSAPRKELYPQDTNMKKTIHDVKFGILLKEKLDELGVECLLSYPGKEANESELDFLLRHFKIAKNNN